MKKQCPTCESIYTDANQKYCLKDGAVLKAYDPGKTTLRFSTSPMTQPTWQRIRPIFAVAAFLLVIVIGVGLVLWQNSSHSSTVQVAESPTPGTSPTPVQVPESPMSLTSPTPKQDSARQNIGQIIRKDGSIEDYIWISIGSGGTFEISKDMDGNDRRQILIKDVSRIDILGPSKLMENGRYIRNIWAKVKISLHGGQSLENVYINAVGNWSYKTKIWSSYIDDNVIAITFTS
jgi:hypothetical protein